MWWIVALLVVLFYVHLFNRIAGLHLSGGFNLDDMWQRWFPYRLVRETDLRNPNL